MSRPPLYIIEAKADGSAIARRQVQGVSVNELPFDDVGAALDYTTLRIKEMKKQEIGLAR